MTWELAVMNFWDDAYRTIPPWDIGHPQPALIEVVEKGEMRPGKVLDVGCGTGENSLFLARSGFTAFGIDMARDAVKAARAKALQRGVKANFELGNALATSFETSYFDNVIDSGLFHTFADRERPVYAGEIARVLRPEGKYFMLCFSDKEPRDWGGPRRVTREEIEESFSPRFQITYIRDTFLATRVHDKGGKAYLTSATKLR